MLVSPADTGYSSGTMRGMCGADAACLAINYQSLAWGGRTPRRSQTVGCVLVLVLVLTAETVVINNRFWQRKLLHSWFILVIIKHLCSNVGWPEASIFIRFRS
ncbi:hypothetical protein T484DRAFT_1926483 [Baffinella frigidus]|nr:hypothetical protein T484DRAFT_1926483 [Cryptophyta sp. CCMP2293]